jgi:hypothetical protein
MVRKGLWALVLAAGVAAGISAGETAEDFSRFSISSELSLVGAGGRAEFMLSPYVSVGVNGYWTSFFFIFNEIGINAVGRFYPWGRTFYAGLGAGLGIHTGIEPMVKDGKTFENNESWLITRTGFELVPELGWKIDPGHAGGFFLNPLVQTPVIFGVQQWAVLGEAQTGDFGVSIGFRAAFGFGWSF